MILTVLGYTIAYRNTIPFGPGPDPFDYVTTARHLAESGTLRFSIEATARLGVDPVDAPFFVPEPYVLAPDQRHYVPLYPPGTSIFMVPFVVVFGRAAGPFLFGPLLGAACLGLFYLLARAWYSRRDALVAVVLLAASPLFLGPARAPLSDVAALFWLLLALIALVRERRAIVGAMAGIAFGCALLTRPNLIALTPALLVLAMPASAIGNASELLPRDPRWKAWAAFGAGLVPLLVLQGTLNAHLYGSPFANGYTLLPGFTRPFAVSYFPTALPGWLLALVAGAGPLTLVAAIYGLARTRRREALAALLWVGLLVGFFCFYRFSGAWSGSVRLHRFVLPAIPVLALAALAGLHQLPAGLRSAGRAALVLGAVGTLAVTASAYGLLQPYSVDPYVPEPDIQNVSRVVGPDGVVFSRVYAGRLQQAGLNAINWSRGDASRARELLVQLLAAGRPAYLLDNAGFGSRARYWLGENTTPAGNGGDGVIFERLGPPLSDSPVPDRREDRKWRREPGQ